MLEAHARGMTVRPLPILFRRTSNQDLDYTDARAPCASGKAQTRHI